MKQIYLPGVVTHIEQLKPCSYLKNDGVIRYDFFQMRDIFEAKLGFKTKGCEVDLVTLGFDIPLDKHSKIREYVYCNFWHYQIDGVFRGQVSEDLTNSIYVGTEEGLDLNKLKKQPNEWQLYLLELWNTMFYHLADGHGWIKVEVHW